MSHLKSLNEFVAKNKARLRLILACGDALIITVPVLICIACITYPARNTLVCNRSWHLQGNPKLVWHPTRDTPNWLAQWCTIEIGTSWGTPKLVWHPVRGTPSWLAQWCATEIGTSWGTLSWGGTLQGAYPIGLLNGVQ